MKFWFSLIVLCSALSASAADKREFATETAAFLDAELPRMDAAVENKDRAYFGPALARMQAFVGSWSGEQLERDPACARALSDFLIAGLCKISPPGTLCEPETFIPKVDKHIAQCRAAAKR
ncbi:hypothetical protein [Duganella vulcania]|uniref:Uncharacterized protein n=1 Tax=Duganella vulcania TaxID=2692166 RepID=A0A845GRI8_9BURK|nr:hypothetical protein [Duganella vulcania]MYM95297.1 hypothetical protein [Duganella vulcania]